MVDEVREGVFFTSPSHLPRGRHDLGVDQVQGAQRERLMIAVTELMAATGYRGVGVRDIAARARVSMSAFYRCFADKDECVFAAYERFIDVLVTRVVSAIDGPSDWEGTVAAVIGAYLDALTSDPVVAIAFQVEMDALGRPARQRRRAALTGMAHMLKTRRDEVWPGAEDVQPHAYVGAVYAVRQLASDRVDDREFDMSALLAEVQPWIARMLQYSMAPALRDLRSS